MTAQSTPYENVFRSRKYLTGKVIGKIWVMYKNMNKRNKSIENHSPLYQTCIIRPYRVLIRIYDNSEHISEPEAACFIYHPCTIIQINNTPAQRSCAGYIGFTPPISLSCHVHSVARCLFHGWYSYVALIRLIGVDVSRTISRSIDQKLWSHRSFECLQSGRGCEHMT